MNTSLTERGGLPLLAAWLAGATVCAVFALIACFALPVVFSAQGGQIFSWVWRPDTHEFGILPMIVGSLLLSVSALLLSWPLAVGVACAIQDGGKKRLFGCTIAGIVRFMTTIPTVVYGFAAVFLLVPVVREAAGKGSGLCWLSAALMLALLILPTMVLVMDSAMRTKERNVRITAAALGLRAPKRWPASCSPPPGAGCSRRLSSGSARRGRYADPADAHGQRPARAESLFGSLRTLTAHMGLVTATEVGGPAYNSCLWRAGCSSSPVPASASRCASWHPNPANSSPSRPLSGDGTRLPPSARCPSFRALPSPPPSCLLGFLLYRGLPTLGPSSSSRHPAARALLGTLPVWDGIWPACAGTFCLIVTTMLLAIGPGIGCGIYLAEYASPSMKRLFGVIMDILAGIPSIVMGIFGFTLILFLHRLGIAGPARHSARGRLPRPAVLPRSWSRPGRLWKGCPPPCA
ncbi:MAG: hypothetical protein ACLSHC_04345 [Bilophila wadsworthia]